MHLIVLQQYLPPRCDRTRQTATQTEQPIQKSTEASGTMYRSHQADTREQRQANPLQQAQPARLEADCIFQVIGNTQGQGACNESHEKQGA
jgi:hypothetical protein